MDLKINNRNGGWGTLLIAFGLIAVLAVFCYAASVAVSLAARSRS